MCECHLGADADLSWFRPPCPTPGPRPVDNLGFLLKAVTEVSSPSGAMLQIVRRVLACRTLMHPGSTSSLLRLHHVCVRRNGDSSQTAA